MEQYRKEHEQAVAAIGASGRDPEDFAFAMAYIEPEPDGGGMFTLQYEIRIARQSTGKALTAIGGIGSDWVGYFTAALGQGYFD